MRLFADKGYVATSTREIAAHAGCNLGLIAHYFGSKEGLFRELVDRRLEEGLVELTKLRRAEGSLRDKLSRFISFLLERMGSDRDFTRLFQRDIVHGGAFMEQYRPAVAALAEIFVDILREARARGELRDDVDPKVGGMLLIAMVQYYFVNYPITSRLLGPASPARIAEIRDTILAVFERGALA
jgi:AcrR family transcriptional regulator